MVSATGIIGGLIGIGVVYGLYRAFSGSSTPTKPSFATGISEDPTNPSLGGRRSRRHKVHGKKTKKHYLKK